MTTQHPFEAMFSGIIGQEYDMLRLICPLAAEMSQLVGQRAGEYCAQNPAASSVLELGGGTGITTLALLSANERLKITSVDNAETMQSQARQSLQQWQKEGRLAFVLDDILQTLEHTEDNSVDIVASAYTLHNFEHGYREQVIAQVHRVLKPEGLFVNGDRYGLDDVNVHTHLIQQEVQGYFSVLTDMKRLDLLEHWIVHLFSDESENHVMRESVALAQLQTHGFKSIQLDHRNQVNARVTAFKSL